MKAHFDVTLSDISPDMLAVSRRLNPEVEHIEGDMRSLRLNRVFDVVLIHDAIAYCVTRDDLEAALGTAAVHCRPGGTVIVAPDYVKETFEPGTDWAATMARTAAPFATWNGRAIRIPPTRPWRWLTPSSFVTRTAGCGPNSTNTTRDSSRKRSGSSGSTESA